MRQQRVKKDIDTHTSPDSEPGSPGFPRQLQRNDSTLIKVEATGETNNSLGCSGVLRQRSEPAPALSPITMPIRVKSESVTHNLLAVPQVIQIGCILMILFIRRQRIQLDSYPSDHEHLRKPVKIQKTVPIQTHFLSSTVCRLFA